jgi:cobalt/nickel transport protein
MGHFLVLLPTTPTLEPKSGTEIQCQILFGHPMDQDPPLKGFQIARVGVVRRGQTIDLSQRLVEQPLAGGPSWTARLRPDRPGDHIFFAEGAPYWEAAERTWLVHSAKVVVPFAGAQVGWDQPIGLPVEILPLTRPYGIWVGNCFRGQVIHQGQPVAGATVEVEFWNAGRQIEVPEQTLASQVLKTDDRGIFCYSFPWAGWWGFAALVDGAPRPGPDGQEAAVELGGTIWIYVHPLPGQRQK